MSARYKEPLCTDCDRQEDAWEHNRTNVSRHDFARPPRPGDSALAAVEATGGSDLTDPLCLDCKKTVREGKHRGRGSHRFIRTKEDRNKPFKSRSRKTETESQPTEKKTRRTKAKATRAVTEPEPQQDDSDVAEETGDYSWILEGLESEINMQAVHVKDAETKLRIEQAKLTTLHRSRELVAQTLGVQS